MKKWILLLAVTAGMSFAGVKTYDVKLADKTLVGATQLTPGDYRLRVEGSRAVFLRYGQTVAQTNVEADNAAQKFTMTEVESRTSNNGVDKLQEIRLAGTRIKLEVKN